MERFDIIVIGAGISGLGLAHYCRKMGLRPCVLEKDARVGGALHSERFGEEFWLEMGAHTAYNSYGRLAGILEGHGLLPRLRKRATSRWMFWEGGRALPVLSRIRLLELGTSLPRILYERKEGSSVAAYYTMVLGPRNYRDVARPMLNAVASQETGGFPADLLFKKRPRRKDIPRSFTLQGGLQSIPEALVSRNGLTILRNSQATAVAEDGEGGFQVRTEGGRELAAPALALATAPDAAVSLLASWNPRLAGQLSRIAVRSVDTIGVVVPGNRVELPFLAGLVGVGEPFYSAVTRDTVPDPAYRGFAFHFHPGTEERERMECITTVLGIPAGAIAHRVFSTRRLPALELGHKARVARIDEALAGGRLLLTGNYFHGLAIEDCLARSEAEAARLGKMLGDGPPPGDSGPP